LETAYQWYVSCRTSHEDCGTLVKSPKWFPTRLLNIGVTGDLEYRLLITSDDIFEPVDYMTLSYRWGDLDFIKLTCANIEELRLGKAISELPQTFIDAIVVARYFSIRYIWIDALCIFQDSKQDCKLFLPNLNYGHGVSKQVRAPAIGGQLSDLLCFGAY